MLKAIRSFFMCCLRKKRRITRGGVKHALPYRRKKGTNMQKCTKTPRTL